MKYYKPTINDKSFEGENFMIIWVHSQCWENFRGFANVRIKTMFVY